MKLSTAEKLQRLISIVAFVHGRGGAIGMQGSQHEYTGLGRGHRERNRLQIAQLADQNDVRILAHGRMQGRGEALRVEAHLALTHEALLVTVHELDRVLDRDDVRLAAAVDLVDARREGRRLARAGRTGA